MVGSKNSIAQAIPLVLSGRSAMARASRHGSSARNNEPAERSYTYHRPYTRTARRLFKNRRKTRSRKRSHSS